MENSPPGIHVIPAGAFSGCGSVFGTVGPKELLAAGVADVGIAAGVADAGVVGADASGAGAAAAVWLGAVRQK
jgi:hypothetical protein